VKGSALVEASDAVMVEGLERASAAKLVKKWEVASVLGLALSLAGAWDVLKDLKKEMVLDAASDALSVGGSKKESER